MLAAPISTISRIVSWNALLCGSLVLCQSVPEKPSTPAASQSSDATHLTFDVVSIHEWRGSGMRYIDNVPRSSFYQAHGVSPIGLILAAYNIKAVPFPKDVPAWATTTQYEVLAKSDAATDEALFKLSDSESYSAKRVMLQQVLADRFKLQIHSETAASSVYELNITPRAAKLMMPIQGEVGKTITTCNTRFSEKGMEVDSKGCPFSILLGVLTAELDTPIVNHTGFTGMYAYHLMWSRPSTRAREDTERYPQLEDAIRDQLGLDLKSTKGPVTIWVVDHIERPSPN
jgi:uncharacterized protein (TIGR03435 family)